MGMVNKRMMMKKRVSLRNMVIVRVKKRKNNEKGGKGKGEEEENG